jgi:hypothetical protein
MIQIEQYLKVESLKSEENMCSKLSIKQISCQKQALNVIYDSSELQFDKTLLNTHYSLAY